MQGKYTAFFSNINLKGHHIYMRKYILLLFSLFIGYSLSAQCLGEDCSIKGRNKAAKVKAAKMTGDKHLNMRARKYKRKGQGFDPFASSSKKGKGMGGFDPFEAEANNKKLAKKGRGFDPFASNDKHRKYKGGGGYDPFDGDNSYSGRRRGKANDSWLGSYGNKGVKGGGYADWDGSGRHGVSGKHSRGRQNDSWLKNEHKATGGGIWADGKTKVGSPRAGTSGSNWDQVMASTSGEPPAYEAEDNTPKSYSEFGGSSISTDITYIKPHQYKYGLICGQIQKTGDVTKSYIDEADLSRPVLGAEFGVEWPAVGEKNYQQYFNIPTVGVDVTYLNLGNEDKLGQVLALTPYIDCPIIRTKPVNFNFSMGAGLAYVTDYDKDNDYNPLVTSPVNAYLRGGFSLDWRPLVNETNDEDEHWTHYTISLGASWIHINDGGFNRPDKGLNILAGELALKYNPYAYEERLKRKATPLPHKFTFDVFGSAGAHELVRTDTKKYVTGNLNMAFYFQAANIYRIGLGADAFYDNAFSDTHVGYAPAYDETKLENQFKGGGFLSNEFVIARTTVALDAGYYFYDPVDKDFSNKDKIYYRLALKYRLTNHFFLGAAVRTHNLSADFATLGMGYSFSL